MLHRLRFVAVLPFLLMLLLAACGTDEDATSTPSRGGSADPTTTAEPSPTDESDATPSPGATDLEGTSWVVVELDGELLVADTEITITFEDGQISGSGGCNTYGADYVAGDESLVVKQGYITEMGCADPEGVMEQEQRYVEALIDAASYRLDAGSNRLEIVDESGQVRIVFADQGESSGTEAPKGTDEPGGTGALDGTDWVLTHVNGEEVAPDPPGTLIFWANQYMGQVGCLDYRGSVDTTPKGELRQMSVDARDIGCERGGAPDLSETYIAALKRVTQYRINNDRLDLLDEIGKIVLSYRPPVTAQSGLDNTSWTLVDLDGAQVVPNTGITLNFSNGGVGGNAGCNGYGSPYTVPVEGVISMPEIVSTVMGCPEPPGVEEQEMAYLQTLYTVSGYRLSDNRLELMNEAGTVVLVYQAAGEDQSSIDGTSWDLVTLNGSPLIDGTQITISITADGSVSGNGGCNNYGREDVIAEDGIISIPDVATTEEDCAEPPGVTDQESVYYGALAGAATYQLNGNTLEFMNEAGETILAYERQ